MIKLVLAFFVFSFFLTPALWAEPRMAPSFGGGGAMSGGFSTGSNSSDWRGGSSPASPRLRSLGVRTVPRSFSNRSQIFSTSNRPAMGLPASGPRGGAFRASVIGPRAMSSAVVRNNMALVNNRTFRGQVVGFNARENVVGHYYWHTYNGADFCHYYDRWGCHWYGWYCGPSFYWSCWWGDHWWWYDPVYYRWCYWYDGWWWWQNPDNVTVVYVYNNGQYVPEESNDQTQTSGDAQEAPAITEDQSVDTAPEAKSIDLQAFHSKDGTRMVKIAGDSGDAFLYDTSASPRFKVKFLGSAVQKASFAKGPNGKMRITLVTKDGASEVFDADGNSIEDNS